MSAVGKTITVEEATIRTATVDVKTLTISGKQVTLAVFRQLKEEPIVGRYPNGPHALMGRPWGTVNYHWAGCAEKRRQHIHVVWEKYGELRRSTVYPSWFSQSDWTKKGSTAEEWDAFYNEAFADLPQLFIAVEEEPMPEHVRQGLIENAGGDLRCPHKDCGLSVSMRQAVMATKPYTVYADARRVNTVAAEGGELVSEMAMVIYLGCGEGHLSHIAFETTDQGTHTETWWDDTPEPGEDEL